MMFHPEEILFATPCASNGHLGIYSTHSSNQFGTGSFLGFGSNIAVGDFDGDGDEDFVTVGASENTCVFIRNQGVNSLAVDTIPTSATRGVVALDYENDGDLDFVTANRTLDSLGITIFLNDGTGHFQEKRNCFFPFASGWPDGIAARDFDGDGKPDIAVVSRTIGGFDSLFVLYNLGGFNGTTHVRQQPGGGGPQVFTLSQNYPNPFNPSTRIQYVLPSQSHVTIIVYNLLGQEVRRLVDEEQAGGIHMVEWNGTSTRESTVGSGVYFLRIEAHQAEGRLAFAQVKKMLLLR